MNTDYMLQLFKTDFRIEKISEFITKYQKTYFKISTVTCKKSKNWTAHQRIKLVLRLEKLQLHYCTSLLVFLDS